MTVVTDEQADALRALCHGNYPAFSATLKRAETERSQSSLVFGTLINIASFLAVERKFKGRPDADIFSWVAAVRSINEKSPDAIDPEHTEAVIRDVLGRGEEPDLEGRTLFQTKLKLLIALTMSPYRLENLEGEEVDKFVAEARRQTDGAYERRAKRAAQGES